MIGKERLKEIDLNKTYNECGITGDLLSIELKPNDYYDLLEQAERVQELEERVFELKARLVIAHQYNDALKMIADDYEKQNKRYLEVLEKIKLNIKVCGNEEYFPKVVEEVVNEALKGGSNE